MRPIDADVVSAILTKLIEEQKKSHHDDEVIGLMEARTEVNNAVTQDVSPVVHAHWIGREIKSGVCRMRIVICDSDGYVADGPCLCSNCGEILAGSNEYAVKGRYCPNCGAVMDASDKSSDKR